MECLKCCLKQQEDSNVYGQPITHLITRFSLTLQKIILKLLRLVNQQKIWTKIRNKVSLRWLTSVKQTGVMLKFKSAFFPMWLKKLRIGVILNLRYPSKKQSNKKHFNALIIWRTVLMLNQCNQIKTMSWIQLVSLTFKQKRNKYRVGSNLKFLRLTLSMNLILIKRK